MTLPPDLPDGEFLVVAERVIVSPTAGRFAPAAEPPDEVHVGTEVGEVVVGGDRIPVRSAFAGRWMGALADPGERVRDGQALAWVRLAPS